MSDSQGLPPEMIDENTPAGMNVGPPVVATDMATWMC